MATGRTPGTSRRSRSAQAQDSTFGVGITPASKQPIPGTARGGPSTPGVPPGKSPSLRAINTSSTVSATALSAAVVGVVLLAALLLLAALRFRRRPPA